MTYILLFFPSIVSAIGLCVSLIYDRNKNASIIASVAAMAVFLLVKDTMVIPKAVNSIVLTFVLVYLTISFVCAVKKKKEDDER